MIKNRSLIQTIISLGIFFFLTFIFFYPQLQGKRYKAGDNVQYTAKSQELAELRKETGREVVWSDAIFSGMPSYFVALRFQGNIFAEINDWFLNTIKRPVSLFLIGLIVMFLSMKALRVDHWLATLGAIIAVYSVNNFILFSAGHMSKVMTIFYMPLLLSGILILFRKKYFLGGILFTFGSVMAIMANHPQMIYYFALAMVPYFIYKLLEWVRSGQAISLAKVYGILIVGVAIGVLSNASRIWTSLEYKNASTRGGSVLVEEAQTNTSEGLGWEYAMQWSNGAKDLWASVIPGAVGGSSQEPVPHDTRLEDVLRNGGAPKKGDKVLGPMYWGELPFTSGPIYFGAAMILVVVFVFPFLTTAQKWLYGGATIMTLLLSLGKNASWFNHILFDYFPMFNNFRAPNSALSILPLFLSYAGMMGIEQWYHKIKVSKNKNIPRGFLIRTGAVVGLCLVVALLGSSLFSFQGENAQNFAKQNLLDIMMDARKALLRQDALRSLLMAALAVIPLWALYKNKLSLKYFSLTLGVIFMIDAIPISYRYFNMDNFESRREFNQSFTTRPVDEQILSRENRRGDYRVLDLSINTFNSNMTSYYHNTIGGYHAVKMSRYQDIIDGYITKGNQQVLNMLNTKYIIDQNGKLQMNPGANGPAWFVRNVEYVDTPDDEFRKLQNLATKTTAVINRQDFGEILGDQGSFSLGEVKLIQDIPDDLIYHTTNSGNGLLVISEIWYDGPGWKAQVDGKEVPLVRADFQLRAVEVPAGEHEVRLTFEPKSYYLGEKLSLGASILLAMMMIFYLIHKFRRSIKWKYTSSKV